MKRWISLIGSCAFASLCASCVSIGAGGIENIAAGERPASSSDEAGLWLAMDKAEQSLKRSARVVADPVLDRYVRDIVCKLAADHCGNIRVYVVRRAGFNASMAPNGAMQVWTGTFLRTQNEAQLAYILAHELGHYLGRHSLKQWRDIRTKTSAFTFIRLAAAVAGAGPAMDLAAVGVHASILAFSREHETEADNVGLELSTDAGYDPREAPKIWKGLMEERQAEDDSEPFAFFSSHPPSQERMKNLESLAQRVGQREWFVGREAMLGRVLPLRGQMLREELRERKFGRTQVLLARLFAQGENIGELHYFQGELYRLRGKEGDAKKARDAYLSAIAVKGAPPETFRELGLLYIDLGEKEKARSALGSYIEHKPSAQDLQMIRRYLEDLGGAR
ncbi:MAG: tetratricopeptide repeat protein [Pseudomonadota bacterium]